jgi:hypothetical protein
MQVVSVIGQVHTAFYIPIIAVVLIARRWKGLRIDVSYVQRDNLLKDEWRTSGSIYGAAISLPVVGRERADPVSTSTAASVSILSGQVRVQLRCQPAIVNDKIPQNPARFCSAVR